MALEIGGETVQPGETSWITVEVARDADRTPVALELYVVNGAESGRVVWLQGGVHGNEPVGGLAIRDLALKLDPADIAGAVVALPVANPSAFANKQRGSQITHVGDPDVNSQFPGSPDGPFSKQLAHRIFSLAAEHADVAVDAHSADEQTVMHTGFTYVPATGDETQERARTLASVTGLEHVVELPPEEIEGFFVAALGRAGIPALMVETGGGANVFPWAHERYTEAYERLLRRLDVLPGDAPDREPAFHDDLSFLFAHAGGYVDVVVQGGDRVEEGEYLGSITDIRGETVETFEAPYDADLLAIRSFPTARPGDMVVELVPSERETSKQ